MTIESVKLEVSKSGLFSFIDQRYNQQTEKRVEKTFKFSCPDGEGIKLKTLLDELKEGDTIRLVFEREISAPSEYRTERTSLPNKPTGDKESCQKCPLDNTEPTKAKL